MGMTITEKILAESANRPSVIPGENVWLNVDVLMTHDVCGPPTFAFWKKEFGEKAYSLIIIFSLRILMPTETLMSFVSLLLNMIFLIIMT